MKTLIYLCCFILVLIIFSTGCTPSSMRLRFDNRLSKEVYIDASSTKNIKPGQTCAVYRSEIQQYHSTGGTHDSHVHDLGHQNVSKKRVGLVKIKEIIDAHTATAEVLSGELLEGDFIEP